jgi:hypothetical protein
MPVAAEIITFPDAEGVAIAFYNVELAASVKFAAVRASTDIPNPRPTMFVRVMRTGGTRRDLITDTPQLVVEAWAAYSEDAQELAEFCRSRIHAASRAGVMGTTTVYELAEYSGPQSLPDPVTDQVRYTATYAIDMRGTVA